MELRTDSVIINASWGAWYPQGSARLERSLIHHGWNHDMLIWKNDPINMLFNEKYPYTIKFAALVEAMQMGYKKIIWMDCSLWVIADPNILMRMLNDKGGLFIRSGYNMAQTSGDEDLKSVGWSRDYAQTKEEIWSCIFGFNLETEEGKNFVIHLESAYTHGVFQTPRTHSGLSQDKRFLHARQDQTAVSLAYHLSGYKNVIEPWDILMTYDNYGKKDKNTIILMRGM